ncbi:MAG TPA: hypothetical protein DCX54_04000 [Flavobacteriales bacterium]|nr:hypothetical protein [Flavobacteriales bacterium]
MIMKASQSNTWFIFLFLFFCASAYNSLAQNNASINHGWTRQIGDTAFDNAVSIATDNSGNILVTGQFRGSCDFDPGAGTYIVNAVGDKNTFIVKYSPQGSLIWARTFSGGFNEGDDVKIDNNGNVLVAGRFYGTVDFDPLSGVVNLSATHENAYVCKLNSFGSLIWVKPFISSASSNMPQIACVDSGNVIMAVSYFGSIDLDPGPAVDNHTSAGLTDIAFVKLNSNGSKAWSYSTGGPGLDNFVDMEPDKEGNVIMTGNYAGSVDFDFKTSSAILTASTTTTFIAKYNPGADLKWAKCLQGTNMSSVVGLAIDNSNNVLITGSFLGMIDFNPGSGVYHLTSAGASDVFLCKLDSSGIFVWAKRIGSSQQDWGRTISTADSNRIVLTGDFSGSIDLDPGPALKMVQSHGIIDYFIVLLDSTGDYVTGFNIGGTDSEYCRGSIIINGDEYYVSGVFRDSVDFDPDTAVNALIDNGGGDGFISKYILCQPSVYDISEITCDSLLSPSGKYYWSKTGVYVDSIVNRYGCDSIVRVDLVIQEFIANVSVNMNTIYALTEGAIYQWLRCDSGFSEIAGATGRGYTPSGAGRFAVIINDNGCIDTSACITFAPAGMEDAPGNNPTIIYPNPIKDRVYLDFGIEYDNVSISLRTIHGQLVYQESFIEVRELTLMIPGPPGLYFLQIESEQGRSVHRVIKK